MSFTAHAEALAHCSRLADHMVRRFSGRPSPPIPATVPLGDALRYLTAHVNLAGGTRMEMTETRPRTYTVTLATAAGPAVPALASVLDFARNATGHPVTAMGVELRGPVLHGRDEITRLFGTTDVHLDGRTDAVTLREGPDAPGTGDDWVAELRALLAEGLPEGPVTLPDMARRLAVSPRTLQRRLHAAGTTWRRELEITRGACATRLLEQADLPRAAVARRLGYSDARSLRRAVRRWERAAAPPGSR
ncbi:MAG TPA: helix-turn-helix domain-containing protein [Thermomonospora sp.]|nr:helix-turn-helix domain-containing protein [Thermomonospora sp.]